MTTGEDNLILIDLFMLLRSSWGTMTVFCKLVSGELLVGNNTLRNLHNSYTRLGNNELDYKKRGKGSTK